MSEQAFQYDDNTFRDCAAFPSHENDACRSLFANHQHHYKRLPYSSEQNKINRFNRFIESVSLVHDHNSMAKKLSFDVTLNQFSDCEYHELPFLITNTDYMGENLKDWEDEESHHGGVVWDKTIRGGMPHEDLLNESNNRIEELVRDDLKVNSNTGPVWISASNIRAYKTDKKDDKDGSIVQSHDALGDFHTDPLNKDWNQYLNWATSDNPDGVSIVHPSSDQGSCGSCWAFSAIGSLEANISRHAAFAAYWSVIEKYHLQKSLDLVTPDIHQEAILNAQQAELSTIQQTSLSVQELVDCDMEFNQGCTGGNPLFAYPFIRRYGLASKSSYPYEGKQSRCHKHLIASPVATVESWGLISPKSEENMELVLRSLGPIAVGLDGSNELFLSYKAGIFDSQNCSRHHPNHAMLIVGMGEEYDDDSGDTIKYWIARNSWGPSWGENGYIRMRRRTGQGSSGVCGIALNPSVALGGSLVSSNREIRLWQQPSNILDTLNTKMGWMNMEETNIDSETFEVFNNRYNNQSWDVNREATCLLLVVALLIGRRIHRRKTHYVHSNVNQIRLNGSARITSQSHIDEVVYRGYGTIV